MNRLRNGIITQIFDLNLLIGGKRRERFIDLDLNKGKKQKLMRQYVFHTSFDFQDLGVTLLSQQSTNLITFP